MPLHRTQRNAGYQEKAQSGASGLFTTLKNLASGSGPNAIRQQGAKKIELLLKGIAFKDGEPVLDSQPVQQNDAA